MTGLVSLVGAGPGAPDLVTLRAVDRLRTAQAVVVDRLVHPVVLAHCPPSAERYYVGKTPGDRTVAQEDINALLVCLAHRGLRVVRLKGGDPFVFGRGGEEVLALVRAGIDYEIVPGLSSALAAPAAAGIPVTHRGVSLAFTVTTGTGAGGECLSELDLRSIAGGTGTLVMLMVVEHLKRTTASLVRYGRACTEPAALVSRATLPDQVIVTAPLGEIAERATQARLSAPAVLIVGECVPLLAGVRKCQRYADSRRP